MARWWAAAASDSLYRKNWQAGVAELLHRDLSAQHGVIFKPHWQYLSRW